MISWAQGLQALMPLCPPQVMADLLEIDEGGCTAGGAALLGRCNGEHAAVGAVEIHVGQVRAVDRERWHAMKELFASWAIGELADQ